MTFTTALLLAFAGASAIFAGIRIILNNLPRRYGALPVVVFVTLQLFLYISSTRFNGIYDFSPSVYRVTGNLLAANSFRPEDRWRRATVTEQPGQINVRHVFVVVDESVTGDALSINGFALPTSPFLKANAARFINFGTATSFTNFSAGSNLALMSGMLMEELPDEKYLSFAKPGVFQYAKKAGYQTYLLDAQTNGQKLQNYTTTQDVRFIDSLFQPGGMYPSFPSYRRDSLLVEQMAAIAGSKGPTFTYVNKAGAHWPYSANVPNEAPDKPPGIFENEAEPAGSYFKSLLWNVDRFWEMLIEKLPANSNVLILYTSDHGENYAARPVKIKHASIYKTPVVEGVVPLIAFDRAAFFPADFDPALNKYSHQYIFPTLLLAMGYNGDFLRARDGKSLLDPPCKERRWFHTGDLFGRGKTRRVFVDGRDDSS
jgi:lipid A ethanolaminephosphotransferase